MLRSYPKPPPFTWLPVTTRPLLPVFPPPEPFIRPTLPSSPRKPNLDAPYTLTTHLLPAAHLRTAAHVPMPSRPPEDATKAERLEFYKTTVQELRDLRTTLEPQGVPQVLWNCVNRYARTDLDSRRMKGVTLFFAHANGFPKEVCSISFLLSPDINRRFADMGADSQASPLLFCGRRDRRSVVMGVCTARRCLPDQPKCTVRDL